MNAGCGNWAASNRRKRRAALSHRSSAPLCVRGIAFLFKGKDGSFFHTTFAYSKGTDTWQWLMDGEEGGKLQSFARVRLTKK